MDVEAILSLLNASGFGDLIKEAKNTKNIELKLKIKMIKLILDNMDEKGNLKGRDLMKQLLENIEQTTDFEYSEEGGG